LPPTPTKKIDAGGVATRPSQAGDKTKPDGVFGGAEDDRDCRACRLGRDRRGIAAEANNHRDLPPNQFRRQRRQPIELVLGPPVFDHDILALDVAGLLQALAKRAQALREPVRRYAAEEANHRQDALLRARRERPRRRRAAEQCNERAASHSITSSARNKSDVGMDIPSA